jgi:hypothetical protein
LAQLWFLLKAIAGYCSTTYSYYGGYQRLLLISRWYAQPTGEHIVNAKVNWHDPADRLRHIETVGVEQYNRDIEEYRRRQKIAAGLTSDGLDIVRGQTKVRYPNIEVQLTSSDGNAFAILGKVIAALRAGRVDKAQIEAFETEATAGDYHNLLRVCMTWVVVT